MCAKGNEVSAQNHGINPSGNKVNESMSVEKMKSGKCEWEDVCVFKDRDI